MFCRRKGWQEAREKQGVGREGSRRRVQGGKRGKALHLERKKGRPTWGRKTISKEAI